MEISLPSCLPRVTGDSVWLCSGGQQGDRASAHCPLQGQEPGPLCDPPFLWLLFTSKGLVLGSLAQLCLKRSLLESGTATAEKPGRRTGEKSVREIILAIHCPSPTCVKKKHAWGRQVLPGVKGEHALVPLANFIPGCHLIREKNLGLASLPLGSSVTHLEDAKSRLQQPLGNPKPLAQPLSNSKPRQLGTRLCITFLASSLFHHTRTIYRSVQK